jgi:hypothetical protein
MYTLCPSRKRGALYRARDGINDAEVAFERELAGAKFVLER